MLNSFGAGGAETGVVRLTKHLSDIGMQHSVCSFSSDMTMQGQLPETVTCYSLCTQGRSYTVFWKLAKLIKNQKVNIVHVNNLGPWLDAFLACQLAGVKCIATFHGIETSSLQLPFLKRKMYSMLAVYSTAGIVVSNAAKRLLEEITGGALSRIRVIPNGIDCSHFTPPSSSKVTIAIREKLGLPTEGLIYGCVAAFRPVKNHRGLIQSFAHCIAQNNNSKISLAFAGVGPEEAKLKDFVFDLGIEAQVFFLGHCLDVDNLLKALDVFCLNSQSEGMSYSILEAMAAGLPVVATDVGSNRELIQHGKSGFLYPSGDYNRLDEIMQTIAQSPAMLKDMGSHARKLAVENYSFTTMAEKYRDLYYSLVDAEHRERY